jgi:hypothetical protein
MGNGLTEASARCIQRTKSPCENPVIFGNRRYRRCTSPTSIRSDLLQGPESGVGGTGGVRFHALVTISAPFEPQTPDLARSRPFCEQTWMARVDRGHCQYLSVAAVYSSRGN